MTVVFLHPLPLDGSVWNEVVDLIDDELDVVPSLYALGETMHEWASAVVDQLGAGPHTIVGNSVGASCAVEIAHLVPDRVERLVVVGGKLGHRPEPDLRDAAISVLADEGVRVFHGREDRSDLCEGRKGVLEFVSGENDRSPPPPTVGQPHIIENIGHYVPLEAPARLAEIILNGAVG